MCPFKAKTQRKDQNWEEGYETSIFLEIPFADCEKTKAQNLGWNFMYFALILLFPNHSLHP